MLEGDELEIVLFRRRLPESDLASLFPHFDMSSKLLT